MNRNLRYQFPGLMMFYAPPDGGGGGGGGTATVAGPAAPATAGEGGDTGGGESDLLSLAAPDIDTAAAFASGKSDAPPIPGKKEPKEPKTTPDAAKPPAKPTGEPPAAQLRKELEATKAELGELKTRAAAGDPKVKELESAVAAKEADLKETRERSEKYRQELLLHNPEVAAELSEMDAKYNATAGRFYRSVTELGQGQVDSLVVDFHKLPFGRPEYGEQRRAWEAKVNDALGAEEGSDHRKLGAAIDFLEQTHDFAMERDKVRGKVQREAGARFFEGQVKGYDAKAKRIDDLIKRAGEVPDDLKTANPLHPDVILNTFVGVLKDEDKTRLMQGVPEFVRFAMGGLKPRSEADYSGMNAQQIAESRAQEEQRFAAAQDHATKILHQGALALRVLPSLWKEVERLRAKVKEDGDGQPPDPSDKAGGDYGAGDDDISTVKAPDPFNLKF